MGSIPSEVLFLGILLVGGGGVALFFWWFHSPKGVIAEARPRGGEPFELRAAPDDARAYRVFLRFDIHFDDGETDYDYGLICDVSAAVAGKQLFRTKVGVGDRLPEGVREIRSQSNPVDSDADAQATIELCEVGPRERGAEIVVTGTITTVDNTAVRTLRVTLAR